MSNWCQQDLLCRPKVVCKSHVWNYFRECKDSGKCMLCGKFVKASNTTNLNNHLIRHHTNVPQIKTVTENQAKDTSRSIAVVKPKAIDASCNQVKIKKNLLTENSSSGSQPRINCTIAKIISHKKGGSIATAIINALIYMIAKDDMPLNTTEKLGFRYFISVAALLYQIPCSTSVTNAVDNKYEVLSTIIKDELKKMPYFTLTTDIWTEKHTTSSFLGYTLHFIEDNNLKSLVLSVTELNNRHTSENIKKEFLSLCSSWGIPLSKVICIVTDNGANIAKAACHTFGAEQHISCLAHTPNLVLSTVMNKIEALRKLIEKVKGIVTYFKHSVAASDELKKVQLASIVSQKTQSHILEKDCYSSDRFEDSILSLPLKLIQEVPTKWNSTFYMLRRFIQLKDSVSLVLLNFPQSPPMLTAAEIEIAREIITILSPIEAITVEMCAEKYTTCRRAVPILDYLDRNLKSADIKLTISKDFRNNIIKQLNGRFKGISESRLHAVATILDPRYKRINFKDSGDSSAAIQFIDKLLKKDKQSLTNADRLISVKRKLELIMEVVTG